ncbi:MAG TPA: hypothetical protein VGL11_14705 [Candidatus Binatia bacterium]
MADLKRRRLHRVTFIAAGIYNLAWGIGSALYPQWLFHWARMEPARYPEIFACLGMIVALYGILYLDVARRPERGWLIAAVGLTGKVLGPLGWLYLIVQREWPVDTILLVATNDFIWWPPFALYLFDAYENFHEDVKP